MKAGLSALLLVLASAGAAQAQTPPDDFARGVALRRAGQPAAAVAPLERAAQANPQDADIWLNLGLAQAGAGQFDAAERSLNQALRLSPVYADAELARAHVAFWRNDRDEASRRLQPVLAKQPQHPEALALQAQLARAAETAPPRWRLDVSAGGASLSKGLPSEWVGAAAVSRSFEDGRFVVGSIEARERFNRTDVYGELTVGARIGYLAIGGAPDADFRPQWAVRGGLAARPFTLGGGWSLQPGFDAAWARYPVGDVRTLAPQATLSRGDELSLTLRSVNVLDERDDWRSGYAVNGAWRAAPRLQLLAGWSDAPESSDGRTVPVEALSLGATVDVNARTTLRMDAVREWRSAYDRDELTVSVTRRF